MASSAKAILSYRTGKRDSENTDLFVRDLRGRVLGAPEVSTDGFSPYQNAIRDAFGNRVAHGVITKTYSVTHLAVNEASRRYSSAAVIAVSRDVVSGVPADISTIRRAAEPVGSHVVAALHALDQRVQQEAREPRCGRVPARDALQHVPRPRNPADHASGRARHRRARLGDWRPD